MLPSPMNHPVRPEVDPKAEEAELGASSFVGGRVPERPGRFP